MVDTPDPDWPLLPHGIGIEATEHNVRMALNLLEQRVQECGWALVGSIIELNCAGDGGFTYTIGMHKRDLPEIITDGLCGCSEEVVCTIADRQIESRAAYEHEQITRVGDTIVRVTRWPYTAHLRLLNEFYRHVSASPSLLMVRPV